jgi:outer membrane receptor protein involved in Fe transport
VCRTPADPHRHYSTNGSYAYAQDSWRGTSRFTLNLGVRYESFGNLRNTGTPDAVIQLGPGDTIEQRLHGASLVFPHGGEALYPASRNHWEGRFGEAYNLFRITVLQEG